MLAIAVPRIILYELRIKVSNFKHPRRRRDSIV